MGRTYVLRGEPVRVLARWGGGGARSRFASMPLPRGVTHHSYVYGDPRDRDPRRSVPRNVLIEYANGRREVRPFRGLRRR